jgi:hypothetical protein
MSILQNPSKLALNILLYFGCRRYNQLLEKDLSLEKVVRRTYVRKISQRPTIFTTNHPRAQSFGDFIKKDVNQLARSASCNKNLFTNISLKQLATTGLAIYLNRFLSSTDTSIKFDWPKISQSNFKFYKAGLVES